MNKLKCRHCGVPWPGDDVISASRGGVVVGLPICIKTPPGGRWLVDSGVNGHMFVEHGANP